MTIDAVAVSTPPSIDQLERSHLLESPQTGTLLKWLLRLIGHDYTLYIEQLRARERSLEMLEAKYGIWEATLARRETDFAALTKQVEEKLAGESARIGLEANRLEQLSRDTEAYIDTLNSTRLRLDAETVQARESLECVRTEVKETRSHLERISLTEVALVAQLGERKKELETLESVWAEAKESASRLAEIERVRSTLNQTCSDLQVLIDTKKSELERYSGECARLQELVTVLRGQHMDMLEAEKARGELAQSVRVCASELQRLRKGVRTSMSDNFKALADSVGKASDNQYDDTIFGRLAQLVELRDAIGTTRGWTLAKRIEGVNDLVLNLYRARR